MNELNENKSGIKKFIVFLIGLVGVIIILHGALNLSIIVSMYMDGTWGNNFFVQAVLTWIAEILFGVLIIYLANRLSHKLMPTSDDLEKRELKAAKKLEKQKLQEEKNAMLDKKRREKRAQAAMDRAANYSAPTEVKAEEEYNGLKFEQTPVMEHSDVEIHFFKKGFALLDFLQIAGGLIAFATVVFGVWLFTYLDANYGTSGAESLHRTGLLVVVIAFWIGLIMFLFGRSWKNVATNSCIAVKNGGTYLVTLNNQRLIEAKPVKIFKYGNVGKLVNSAAVINARIKYHAKIQEAFLRDDFKDTINRMFEYNEYNTLFEIVDINNNKKYNKGLCGYLYKKYLKEIDL